MGVFKKVIDATTSKENPVETDNFFDLTVKCPKRHVKLDKLLRETYGICPIVHNTSNKQHLKTFDVNYTIKVYVTLPKADFFDERVNAVFTRMQKEALKIISRLDVLNQNKSNQLGNIEFITLCVSYFEIAKEYFKGFNNMTQELKDRLKASGKQDKVNINMSITTNASYLNY